MTPDAYIFRSDIGLDLVHTMPEWIAAAHATCGVGPVKNLYTMESVMSITKEKRAELAKLILAYGAACAKGNTAQVKKLSQAIAQQLDGLVEEQPAAQEGG